MAQALNIHSIDSGDFLLLDLHACVYYINRSGHIYSMNHEEPRLIEPTQKSTGEMMVVLFTPRQSLHLLAHLVLSTFSKQPHDNMYVCYKDDDPKNVHFDNLFWGTYQEQRRWMSKLSHANGFIGIASSSPKSSINSALALFDASAFGVETVQEVDVQTNMPSLTFDVPQPTDGRVWVNEVLLLDITHLTIQFARLSLSETSSEQDVATLRRIYELATEITSSNLVKPNKITQLFKHYFDNEQYRELLAQFKRRFISHEPQYLQR